MILTSKHPCGNDGARMKKSGDGSELDRLCKKMRGNESSGTKTIAGGNELFRLNKLSGGNETKLVRNT